MCLGDSAAQINEKPSISLQFWRDGKRKWKNSIGYLFHCLQIHHRTTFEFF